MNRKLPQFPAENGDMPSRLQAARLVTAKRAEPGAGTKFLHAALSITLTAALAAPARSAPAPDFTVHEWGTFTSVSTSDGRLLAGVEGVEEALPPFVYSHEGMGGPNANANPLSKGWSRPLCNVTVRMETPVLYFYTDQSFPATIDVGFEGGSISQWYPQRSGGETPPPARTEPVGDLPAKLLTLDFGAPYQGSIQWKVDVFPAPADAFGLVFKPHETPSWLYPRQTDSALVRTESGETEKYLFYRGVGMVPSPYRFFAGPSGVGTQPQEPGFTAAPLIFQNEGGKARWKSKRDEGIWSNLETKAYSENWRRGVYEEMAGRLVHAGLFRKEADAMLQTWWNSYFEREGTRVFWIATRAWTDRILPLKIEPAPRETVRVMVGRTEILTPEFEAALVKGFTGAEQQGRNAPWQGDRFFPAYAARVKELRSPAGPSLADGTPGFPLLAPAPDTPRKK